MHTIDSIKVFGLFLIGMHNADLERVEDVLTWEISGNGAWLWYYTNRKIWQQDDIVETITTLGILMLICLVSVGCCFSTCLKIEVFTPLIKLMLAIFFTSFQIDFWNSLGIVNFHFDLILMSSIGMMPLDCSLLGLSKVYLLFLFRIFFLNGN